MNTLATSRSVLASRSLSILLGLLTVGACLLLGELGARALLKDSMAMFPRYHTDAHYGEFVLRRLAPNSVFWHTSPDGRWQFVTNSQGFRDYRDYAYAKPAGVLRVLALGDSHTQGFEVRQSRTYSEVLERYLGTQQIKAEVLNTGISGFGTAEQLAFLENEGIRYTPDVVVLGFYGNDFEDNVKSALFKLEDGELVLNKTTHIPGVRVLNALNSLPPARWLSENSYLYSFAMNTGWQSAKRLAARRASENVVLEYAIPVEEVSDYSQELTLRLLERMSAFCRERGIALIVLDIPVKEGNDFRSSVPDELVPTFEAVSDAFINSEHLLEPYRAIAEIHLPNGQRHISEFTHLMLGIAAAQAITQRRQGPGDDS